MKSGDVVPFGEIRNQFRIWNPSDLRRILRRVNGKLTSHMWELMQPRQNLAQVRLCVKWKFEFPFDIQQGKQMNRLVPYIVQNFGRSSEGQTIICNDGLGRHEKLVAEISAVNRFNPDISGARVCLVLLKIEYVHPNWGAWWERDEMLLTTGIGLGLISGATGLAAWQYGRTDGLGMTVNAVFAACGLCNRGKDGHTIPWEVKRVVRRENGSRLILRFPYGKTLSDVIGKTEAISTALGADVAFARDGGYLLMDILQFPLPTYLPYEMRLLELTRGTWRVPVGRSIEGMVMHDFDAYPHLLVAGPTRGGKTVFLKNVIATLHVSHKASEIEFIGVDMKPFSLGFRKFAGVWNQLASTPEQFLAAIRATYVQMEKRAETLAKANCENVQEYEQTTGERFKRLFLIVDEYGKSFGSDVEDDITSEMLQLTALGAGLGVHVVLCTQRPDSQVIDGKIKANIEAIVCFGAANGIQSRVILGHEGAEDLPDIRGRAIYQTDREVTLQVPYLSDKKLTKILPNNVPLPVHSRGIAKIGDTSEVVQGLSKIADTHNPGVLNLEHAPDNPRNEALKRLQARSAQVVRLHD